MVLKKACYCLSLRLGTLIFLGSLTLYLMWTLYRMMAFLIHDGNEGVYGSHGNFYSIIFTFWIIEILIYSATIISDLKGTPSIFLLWTTFGLFILHMISSICFTIQSVVILVQFRRYYQEIILVNCRRMIILVMMIYAMFVFFAYISELKQQSTPRVPNEENFDRRGDNFILPSFNNAQHTTTVPQYPQIPPQYPQQAS